MRNIIRFVIVTALTVIIIYIPLKSLLENSVAYQSEMARDSLLTRIAELEEAAKGQRLKIREGMREAAELQQTLNDMKFKYEKLQTRNEELRKSRAPIINAFTAGDVESYLSKRYKQPGSDSTAVDDEDGNNRP